MTSYQKKLLNKLVDSYEKSKTHIGANKTKQRFTVEISKLFPEYADESDYASFEKINSEMQELEDKSFISLKIKSGEMIDKAELNVNLLEKIYTFLERKPKKDTYAEALALFEEYQSCNPILEKFCSEQIANIETNKTVKYVSPEGDCGELEKILIALKEIINIQSETFYRDFSVRVYGDSKAFDMIKDKVVSILCRFDESADEASVLADMNLIKNPGHVYFKGNAVITLNGQPLDISGLSGDIGISSEMLRNIDLVKTNGKNIVTVENLTSFHSYRPNGDLVIYLGGYHNTLRRDFIRKIYNDNPDKNYLHFGDIDAGGFYILEHLRNRTKIDFKPYHMDVPTLIKYKSYCKQLTENDKKRLGSLLGRGYDDVILYMLENNCKLEQEAIDDV